MSVKKSDQKTFYKKTLYWVIIFTIGVVAVMMVLMIVWGSLDLIFDYERVRPE